MISYERAVFWIKVGRLVAVGAWSLVGLVILTWPIMVWHHNHEPKVLWMAYGTYIGIAIVLGLIGLGTVVSDSRHALSKHGNMESIFDPLPPQKPDQEIMNAVKKEAETVEKRQAAERKTRAEMEAAYYPPRRFDV